MKKFLISLLCVITGTICLTGCRNEVNHTISRERLDEKSGELPSVVQSYFEDKYGENIKTSITYQGIAGGTFLGSKKNELYYHLMVNVVDGESFVDCYVNVYAERIEDNWELYVKEESYYGYIIKERMEAWLENYLKKTNIDTYSVNFFTAVTIFFPAEYEYEKSAEEIIESVGLIKENINRPLLRLCVNIPKSEYESHSNIEDEFIGVKSEINRLQGKLELFLDVYEDENYLELQTESYNHSEPIETIQIY